MTILFTSDLHGSERLYRDLFWLAGQANVETVVLGGDLLPNTGGFPNMLKNQRTFIEGFLAGTLERWTTLLPHLTVYALMGNDDWSSNMDALESLEAKELLKLLHLRCHDIGDGITILGCSFVPPTPFSMKDWERRDLRNEPWFPPFSYARFDPYISTPEGLGTVAEVAWFSQHPSLEEILETLRTPPDWRRALCVFHCPPYCTRLDVLESGKPIGSKAVRDFILRHEPLVTLHGHIHESPYMSGSYKDRLGKTVCVNPGRDGDRLHAVLFDTEDPGGTMQHTVFGGCKVKQ